MELTGNSLEYVQNTSLEKRKKLGQYMTPASVSHVARDFLKLKPGDKIIDPAVGTGELLLAVAETNPDVKLYGWDVDSNILKTAEKNLGNKAELTCVDGLTVENFNGFFDAAIVNPPYFELKPTVEQKNKYGKVISGRANIYAFFIQKTLELVKEDGQVAFIIPPSMNNGTYFDALRKYVIQNSEIVNLKVIKNSSLFIEAQTAIQILVLKKTSHPKMSKKHVVDLQQLTNSPVEKYLFTEDSKKIMKMWENKKSLHELGFQVTTGSVAWNDWKGSFSEKQTEKHLPLYYSKDISNDGKLILNPSLKNKRFLLKTVKPYSVGEAIIVNRIVGGVGVGNIRAAIVDGEYYTENHVNVITPRADVKPNLTLKQLHKKLITNENLGDYIKLFTGNTQLSAKELNFFLPL